MVVGIDYSMNSVGICVYNKGYKFYSFINQYSLSAAKDFNFDKNLSDIDKNTLTSIDGYNIFIRKPNSINKKLHKSKRNEELNRWHRQNTIDSINLANNIMLKLTDMGINKDTKFVIENYLTNRNGGDATIQLIEFTKSFKDKLVELVGIDNITIISAPEIKMIAGNGNYTKKDMLFAFIDESLDSKFRIHCEKHKLSLMKGTKDVRKPIDDIIDAYYATKWFVNKNKHENW